MDTRDAISKRIVKLCEERNITINKLCAMSGATQSTINDIVNGVTKNPGIVTIKKLCDGLEITLCEFFNSDLFHNLEQEIK
ncbi:MAG TPA: helix-turn-helix transcriptional regulator [Candidatus Aphodoplasma excrementigallinarum]|uniref:Helix-turn-helix transcriptional regulator n=1 Tax=Candidatus Aphodoplasma excrementigallinarum TaxID=2840673 RepID=A0A9D1NH41_9FIRM|nr:helix-turn-helix transcriptional regulator [Candidatus Aphodoplasma excrementigallinarum]